MTKNPFDWAKSICQTKENLLLEFESKNYNPYIVNKSLSHHIDCLMLCNEMNFRPFLDKDVQYTFLLNTIRKRKRNYSWIKKEEVENIDLIKKFYNINTEKAYQALKILSGDQIDYIKNKLENIGI